MAELFAGEVQRIIAARGIGVTLESEIL